MAVIRMSSLVQKHCGFQFRLAWTITMQKNNSAKKILDMELSAINNNYRNISSEIRSQSIRMQTNWEGCYGWCYGQPISSIGYLNSYEHSQACALPWILEHILCASHYTAWSFIITLSALDKDEKNFIWVAIVFFSLHMSLSFWSAPTISKLVL